MLKNNYIAFLICGLYFIMNLFAAGSIQAQTGPSSYYVEFKDKKNSPYSVNDPLKFLSKKALDRRAKHHIPVTEQDFPVNPWYLDSLKAAGAHVLYGSRWFNAATIRVDTDTVMNRIRKLTFVRTTQKVMKIKAKVIQTEADQPEGKMRINPADYGESFTQLAMMNGDFLHDANYKGQGVLIAIIDAGFNRADTLNAFKKVFREHRVVATHDFVEGTDSVYHGDLHGMWVFSTIGGEIPGKLIGTAPEAGFILLRSENSASEYLIEEDNWDAAAEFADSAGADVINSSLGYTTFDDPNMNHIYPELDGHTTRITRAANYAFSKGILVVCSAGNEGRQPWKHISAPADGDSVLAIGAVDSNRNYVSFSSQGPSASNKVKPNVSALGYRTIVASAVDGQIDRKDGTSLSSPLVAGLTACLVGAFPNRTNREIKKAIEISANQYTHPDNLTGYGIPDFKIAFEILSLNNAGDQKLQDFIVIQLYPNPFKDDVSLTYFSKTNEPFHVVITDNLGKEVFNQTYQAKAGTVDKVSLGVGNINSTGMYILTLTSGNQKITKKIMKAGL